MDGPSSPTVPKTKGDFAVPPIRIGAGGHRPQCASQPALIRPIQHARGTAEGGGGGGRLRDAGKRTLNRFVVQNTRAVVRKTRIWLSPSQLSLRLLRMGSHVNEFYTTSSAQHDCNSHKFKPLVGGRPLHRFAVPLPRASRGGGTRGVFWRIRGLTPTALIPAAVPRNR